MCSFLRSIALDLICKRVVNRGSDTKKYRSRKILDECHGSRRLASLLFFAVSTIVGCPCFLRIVLCSDTWSNPLHNPSFLLVALEYWIFVVFCFGGWWAFMSFVLMHHILNFCSKFGWARTEKHFQFYTSNILTKSTLVIRITYNSKKHFN